jgi:hypothetical protein
MSIPIPKALRYTSCRLSANYGCSYPIRFDRVEARLARVIYFRRAHHMRRKRLFPAEQEIL